MGEVLEERITMWEGLKDYQPSRDEETEIADGYRPEVAIKILKKLIPNQSFPVAEMSINEDSSIDLRDTRYFQEIIKELNEIGFDVGKGDAEYGFKMPPPKNGRRQLIVFRRK